MPITSTFVKGEPQTSAALNSSNVRTNLDAIFEGDIEPLRVRAQSSPDMTVAVSGDNNRSYVNGNVALDFSGGNSSSFTAPTGVGEKRIDVLSVDSSGVLNITTGTDTTGTPTPPTYPEDELVLAEIYLRYGMSSVKNTDDSTNGYIFKQRTPIYNLGAPPSKLIQTGVILPYGSTTIPTGYLLCDGSLVSRTTYADLFAVVGENYDPGDESSTFGLPDFQSEISVASRGFLIDRADGTAIGDMTFNGGLAAAFDITENQAGTNCARGALNTTTTYVGKDWGSGNTNTIYRVMVYGANDQGFHGGYTGTIVLTIQGSTDNFSSSVVDLGSLTFTDTSNESAGREVFATDVSTAYRYHRIKIQDTDNPGNNEMYCAEVKFYKLQTYMIKT